MSLLAAMDCTRVRNETMIKKGEEPGNWRKHLHKLSERISKPSEIYTICCYKRLVYTVIDCRKKETNSKSNQSSKIIGLIICEYIDY